MSFGYGGYCQSHHLANRKNGHPEQISIRAPRLKPYIKMIEDRYQNTPAGPAWPIMQRRWQSLVNHALLLVRKADQGVPYNRYELHSAEEIVKLHEEQRWQDVMFRAASVFILQDFEPWAFKSDKAVRFQLQRLVRSLGPTHTAEYIKNGGGTGKQYPYYPPKTAEILGQWLADTFGVLGLRIVELERHKDEIAKKDREDFQFALETLR